MAAAKQASRETTTGSGSGSSRYYVQKLIKDPGVRITAIGMACNLALSLAKLVAGSIFKSEIIVADGWHSMTDLVSDAFTLLLVSLRVGASSSQKSRARLCNLGGLALAGMLLTGGCVLGFNSLQSLLGHFTWKGSSSFSMNLEGRDTWLLGPVTSEALDLDVVWVAVASVAVKEWLYHATMKIANESRSAALKSNAAHHRMDSMAGMVTILAVLGAATINNAGWIDPLGGLITSLMIVRSGSATFFSALTEST